MRERKSGSPRRLPLSFVEEVKMKRVVGIILTIGGIAGFVFTVGVLERGWGGWRICNTVDCFFGLILAISFLIFLLGIGFLYVFSDSDPSIKRLDIWIQEDVRKKDVRKRAKRLLRHQDSVIKEIKSRIQDKKVQKMIWIVENYKWRNQLLKGLALLILLEIDGATCAGLASRSSVLLVKIRVFLSQDFAERQGIIKYLERSDRKARYLMQGLPL